MQVARLHTGNRATSQVAGRAAPPRINIVTFAVYWLLVG